jgi:hypothetical protein
MGLTDNRAILLIDSDGLPTLGPPGFPLQPAEAWYCGAHRHEGEWPGRRPSAFRFFNAAGASDFRVRFTAYHFQERYLLLPPSPDAVPPHWTDGRHQQRYYEIHRQ